MAQLKYRVALKAIENGDWAIAEQNLQEAVSLEPKNSALWYNLAVVQSKLDGKLKAAIASLQQAIDLGLSGKAKDQADDLMAELAYKSQTPAITGYWVDPKSSLMWTVKDNGNDLDWNAASRHCRGLTLGGFTGWRLPSIEELQLLWVPSAQTKYKIANPLQLSGCCVWSSTIHRGEAAIQFYTDGSHTFDSMRDSVEMRALCVRGSSG